ncbi:MAG: DUF4388 domain-containing protein [Acidobacteria bacterium]|nr:DUF4388 domain-containing protein [Acidobacteriota bacterium]
MEALTGDLAQLRLMEILKVLTRSGKTGILQVLNGAQYGEVYLEGGELVHASCAGREGEEAIHYLFSWGEGRFHFVQEEIHPPRTVAGPTQDVLARGEELDREWQSVRSAVPSLDVVFALSPKAQAEVTLSPREWGILRYIDGRQTVHEIAVRSGHSELTLARILARFHAAGLVELAAPAAQLSHDRVEEPLFQQVVERLTHYEGPIASVLLEEQIQAFQERRENFPRRRLAELMERLSESIDGKEQRLEFQRYILELLKRR